MESSTSPKTTTKVVMTRIASQSPLTPATLRAKAVATAVAAILTRLFRTSVTVRTDWVLAISQAKVPRCLGCLSWRAISFPFPMEVMAVSLKLKSAERKRSEKRSRSWLIKLGMSVSNW